VSEAPDLSTLPPELIKRITYDPKAGQLKVMSGLSDIEVPALKGCFKNKADKAAIDALYRASKGFSPTVVKTGKAVSPISVPVLARRVQGELIYFDEDAFHDHEWSLANCNPTLSEAEFSVTPPAAKGGEIDVTSNGKVETSFVEDVQEQLALMIGETGWTVAALANWLDRNIPHRDVAQSQSSLFIYRVLEILIEKRGVSLEKLARRKFALANAIQAKISEFRQAAAESVFQRYLFGDREGEIEVSPDLCFTFDENAYAPNWYYEGSYHFTTHFFRLVGELKSDGEEFECAQFIDQMPQIETWVRNIERRQESSFWLQTSTDRFYPDFVARVNDGRVLVVEYKNERDWSNDDSREKRALGDLWANRSGGRCIFIMPKGKDFAAISAVIS